MKLNTKDAPFTYSNPAIKKVLMKYALIHYSVILLLIVFYYLTTYVNIRNADVIRYLVLIQITFMLYQSVPVISDLLKNKGSLLDFDGRIVNKKGIFITTLTIKAINRKKMKLLTDKKGLQLGMSINGTCTRYGKVIVSFRVR